jgi:CBS domain-containing protein
VKTLGQMAKEGPLHVVQKDQTALEAAQLMTEKRIGAVPVLEGDQLVGIFTERDLMTRVVAANKPPSTVTVGEVMTCNLIAAEADESYQSALRKMQRHGCRHLPVVSGEQLVGIVSLRDLLTLDREIKEEEIQLLDAYIRYIPPPPARD